MNRESFYLSTIADDAAECAAAFGLGLEIAEYCTACNMDEEFSATDAVVREKMALAKRFTLHAPFNELFPSAIDPKAVALAHSRLSQAVTLAGDYGIRKVVIHAGYMPRMYYRSWFEERSILFWKEFLRDKPTDVTLCLENVFEEEPEMLRSIVETVDDPRLRLCLDVGHVNCYSPVSVERWMDCCGPWLAHFHLHSNAGDFDAHGDFGTGTVPMETVLRLAEELCPYATAALETLRARPSVQWLAERGFLHD